MGFSPSPDLAGRDSIEVLLALWSLSGYKTSG